MDSGTSVSSAYQIRTSVFLNSLFSGCFKESDSQSLLLPFLALFPFPHPAFHTLALSCVFHTLTPPPSFRDPNVPGNGISWSLLILTGQFLPSPTHTLSFHPALVRALERNRKVLVSSLPLSLPCASPLPAPSTRELLNLEQRGNVLSAQLQTVWCCPGFL